MLRRYEGLDIGDWFEAPLLFLDLRVSDVIYPEQCLRARNDQPVLCLLA